jgi:uncharacterized damage-inducible protein DinB
MESFVDRAELLRRLASAYSRLRDTIAPLSPDQLQAPGVVGEWSIKDLVAHFIAHEQFALGELAAAQRGEQPSAVAEDLAAYNARAVAARTGDAAEAVLRAWGESFMQVVETIQGLTEADFDPVGPLAQALGDTIDGTFGNNTYDHYLEHLGAVEAWIARL